MEQLPSHAGVSIPSPEIMKTVIATGSLNASVNIEVGSQLSGQVAALAVDFNDFVKKGQILAHLDDSKYQAEVEAARAGRESARADERIVAARLERATIDVRQTEMQREILEAHAEKTRIALDAADREVSRKRILSERHAASETDVQDASDRRAAARATLREAQAELGNHVNLTRVAQSEVERVSAELDKARAVVMQLDAQFRAAAVDLERTNIRAPIDGVIIGRNITQGQTLATALEARTLFVVAADLRDLEIWAKVDESDIARIAVGQNAMFSVDSFPGREFAAKVTQIRKTPQIVQNVVTYTVVLEARNEDYALLPGMTVLARIDTLPSALTSNKVSSVSPEETVKNAATR
jgi:HlyD family secretion protein